MQYLNSIRTQSDKMLLSFSITNFKSFKDERCIELCPGNSRSKKDHLTNGLLPITSIFGPNGSGKSNFIKGLETLKSLVTNPYFSTRLPISHWESNQKTTFKISFMIGKDVFRYALSVQPIVEDGFDVKNPYRKMHGVSIQYMTVDERLIKIDSNDIEKILIDKEEKSSMNMDKIMRLHELKNVNLKMNESIFELNLKINELKIEKENGRKRIAYLSNLIKRIDKKHSIPHGYRKFSINSEISSIKDNNSAVQKKINKLRKELVKIEKELSDNYAKLDSDIAMNNDVLPELYTNPSNNKEIDTVLNWFNASLIILGTSDYYMPPMINDLLPTLSKTISNLDLGITRMVWKKIKDKDTMDYLKNRMSEKDRKRIRECKKMSIQNQCGATLIAKADDIIYRISYWNGIETMEKIAILHSNSLKSASDLSQESDGTKRIVDLASILLPTNADTTFVIDELNRRIHPLLSVRFIELFLNSCKKKPGAQLIFTTHETRLLTTEIFRLDEIWYVEKQNDVSDIKPYDETDVNLNRRLDNQYFDGTLPGAPKISLS